MMIRKRARVAFVLVWVMITCVILSSVERCQAASGADFGSAKRITKFGNKINDRMNGSGKCRYYKVRISHTSVLKLQVSSNLKENLYLKIYNEYHNELNQGEITRDVNGGRSQNTFTYYLEKGTYYIGFYMIVAGQRGSFSFVPTCSTLACDEKESNNDIGNAQPLSFEGRITGLLTETDRVDIYSINMKKDGKLSVNISPGIQGDFSVEVIAPQEQYSQKQEISGNAFAYKREVKKGIYYIKLNGQGNKSSGKYMIWLSQDISIDSLKVSHGTKSLSVGESFRIKYTKVPNNATEEVIFSTSNSKVATVSKSGKVVGKQSGMTTISIGTKRGRIFASCKVKVQEGREDSFVLNPDKVTMEVGDTLILERKVLSEHEKGKKVLWSSNKPEVAMVNKEGKVTAIAQGICTVAGTIEGGGATAKCEITVKENLDEEKRQDEMGDGPMEELEMERSCLVKEGEERVMLVTSVKDGKEVKDVQWSSSNSQVLKVDKTGKIMGVSQGVAVVVAQVEGRKNNYCTVLVRRRK